MANALLDRIINAGQRPPPSVLDPIGAPEPISGGVTPDLASESRVTAIPTPPDVPRRPDRIILDGILSAVSAVDELRQRRATSIEELEAQDVDVTTGLSAGTRARLSAREPIPGLRKKFLDENFTAHRETDIGTVVTIDGKEILVDESQLTFRDLADLTEEGIIAAGAIAGALATVPAAGGLVVSAAVAALVGQGFGAAKDIVLQIKNSGNLQDFIEIAERRGVGAAIDFGFDLITGGAARAAKGAINLGTNPFGKSSTEVLTMEARRAADELGATTLPPSELTGSEALARAESLVGKIPGSTRVLGELDEATDAQLRKVVNGLAPDAPSPRIVGEAIVARLNQNVDQAQLSVDRLKEQARVAATIKVDNLSLKISPFKGGIDDAGLAIRERVKSIRDQRKKISSALYDETFTLPEAKKPFLKVQELREFVAKEKAKFPQETVTKTVEVLPAGRGVRGARRAVTRTVETQQASRAFLPVEAIAFFTDITKLDNMTIEQAIKGRGAINDAIREGSALSSVGQGALKTISNKLTKMIDDGTASLPAGDLRTALVKANDNYKSQILPLGEQGVAKLFRKVGQPGSVENDVFVTQLFLGTKKGERERVKALLGEGSQEWRDTRKAFFSNILEEAGSLLDENAIDPKKILSQLGNMTTSARADLLGPQRNAIIKALREVQSAGDLDLSRISIAGDVASKIRQAAREKQALDATYKNTVIKPFLEGKTDASNIVPEEFIKHFINKASLRDIDTVLEGIGPNSTLATDLRKRVIMDLLEKSHVGEIAPDIIARQLGEGSPIGAKLTQVLKEGLGPETSKKLEKLLGADTLRTLNNLGVLNASRERRKAIGSAAGGIVAGVIQSGMLLGRVAVLPSIIKYRLAAALLSSPLLRGFAKLSKKTTPLSRKAMAAALATPQMLEVIRAEFNDDPQIGEAITDAFIEASRSALTGAATTVGTLGEAASSTLLDQ